MDMCGNGQGTTVLKNQLDKNIAIWRGIVTC